MKRGYGYFIISDWKYIIRMSDYHIIYVKCIVLSNPHYSYYGNGNWFKYPHAEPYKLIDQHVNAERYYDTLDEFVESRFAELV